MKRRLLVAVLSIAVLTMASSAPVEAAKHSDQGTNLTQMKADAKRVEKLRHGYIKYDENKMYYYW